MFQAMAFNRETGALEPAPLAYPDATPAHKGLMTRAQATKVAALADAPAGLGAVDANGWYVDASPYTGKRRWRRRFLGLATTATTAQSIVAATLPVGVANLGAVDAHIQLRLPGGTVIVALLTPCTDATTTLSVYIQTVDGSNLSASAATVDIFAELVER